MFVFAYEQAATRYVEKVDVESIVTSPKRRASLMLFGAGKARAGAGQAQNDLQLLSASPAPFASGAEYVQLKTKGVWVIKRCENHAHKSN